MSSINAKAATDMFNIIYKARSAIQKVTKATLLEIGYRLVARSAIGDPNTWHPPYWPKGYTPGTFINNWQLGIDEVPRETQVSGPNELGTESYTRFSKLGRWPAGHTYYFVNNLPYAKLLESGTHSPQVPPGGMVGLTVLEFPQIVREAELNYSKVED